MKPWAGLPINDDEDAEALLAEFIRLCVHYKITDNDGKHTFMTVGRYVFAKLRDPGLRGEQCGKEWGDDIAVLEKIKHHIANGFEEKTSLTKAEWQAKIIAVSENSKLSPQEKKSILDGLRLYGESEGWLIKSAEPKGAASDKPSGAAEILAGLAKLLPN